MKKKNQFDSKDIMLLAATLIIIYVIISWFGNYGDLMDYGNQTSMESQTGYTEDQR